MKRSEEEKRRERERGSLFFGIMMCMSFFVNLIAN